MHKNESQEYLSEYKDTGFCRVTSFFLQDEVKELEKEIAAFVKLNSTNLAGRDVNYSGTEVNSIHALTKDPNSYFSRLINSPRLKELAGVFLEEEAVPRAAEFFAKPPKVGLPSPWHQDNAYWCVDNANALTIWIALDACDESNGVVTYYKGTHKLGLIDHKPSHAPGSSQTVADTALLKKLESEKAFYTLKPGDVLIHHTLVIHGSAANMSDRARRGITLQYMGKSSKIDLSMKQRYEESLASQIKSRIE